MNVTRGERESVTRGGREEDTVDLLQQEERLQGQESQRRDLLVRVERLTVNYGDRQILNDVSLEVERGDFVSIIGLSGSGKTTLLNAIAGFIPGHGAVQVAGRIGVVFQDYAAFPFMTVFQNVAFGLERMSRAEKRRIVDDLLVRIGLSDHAHKYPAQLSGGQVQRVGLARAIAPDPDIILMDEPYGALDRHTRDAMQEWLLEVWSETSKTILFVTHDIEEALYLSNRIVVIANGQIHQTLCVPFPRPRTEEMKFSPTFSELRRTILEIMRQ